MRRRITPLLPVGSGPQPPPGEGTRGPSGRLRLFLARVGLVVAVLAGLAAASLSLPVEAWRTGRSPAPALNLVPGGPPVPVAPRIWVDTDAACGAGGRVDSDDCLALLALLRSDAVEVVGVSSVAGNAPLDVTHRITRALLDLLAEDRPVPPLYRGADGGTGPNRAAAGLRRALAEGPVTVLALGPLTNVAAALTGHPEAAARVSRLIAVMGRRRGHLFHPSEGAGRGATLFGHGPVFTDFNLRQDPAAAEQVFRLPLPVTLIPYDAATTVPIDAADLDRLASTGGSGAWVAARSRPWLAYWNDVVGRPGFYPFDLLAAGYVLAPERFHCAEASAWVAPAPDLLGGLYAPVSLLVGRPEERPERVRVAARALYCPRVDCSIHDVLLAVLLGRGGYT